MRQRMICHSHLATEEEWGVCSSVGYRASSGENVPDFWLDAITTVPGGRDTGVRCRGPGNTYRTSPVVVANRGFQGGDAIGSRAGNNSAESADPPCAIDVSCIQGNQTVAHLVLLAVVHGFSVVFELFYCSAYSGNVFGCGVNSDCLPENPANLVVLRPLYRIQLWPGGIVFCGFVASSSPATLTFLDCPVVSRGTHFGSLLKLSILTRPKGVRSVSCNLLGWSCGGDEGHSEPPWGPRGVNPPFEPNLAARLIAGRPFVGSLLHTTATPAPSWEKGRD